MNDVPVISPSVVWIGARHRAIVIDLMPESRLCWAIRTLFLAGFDTTDIAGFSERSEAEVLRLLSMAPGPQKVEVTP